MIAHPGTAFYFLLCFCIVKVFLPVFSLKAMKELLCLLAFTLAIASQYFPQPEVRHRVLIGLIKLNDCAVTITCAIQITEQPASFSILKIQLYIFFIFPESIFEVLGGDIKIAL